jgi:antitoxin HicB
MPYSLYDYHIEIFRDERDNDFGAFIREIPHVSAFGTTPADAIKELETAFFLWHETSLERGDRIPGPAVEPESADKFSGRFSVRLPRSLHMELTERAKKEDISLNQEILYLLALALGTKKGHGSGRG